MTAQCRYGSAPSSAARPRAPGLLAPLPFDYKVIIAEGIAGGESAPGFAGAWASAANRKAPAASGRAREYVGGCDGDADLHRVSAPAFTANPHGGLWHFTRPPIETIEYEMDVRDCRTELVL